MSFEKIKVKQKLIAGMVAALVSYGTVADVRVWVSATTTDGDIPGAGTARANADALCDADANKPAVVGSTTRALISIDGNDEIRDMPANYNVPTNETIHRADGTTTIAADWTALLSASTTPLVTAIGTDNAIDTHTGSFNSGALAFNCSGYTNNGSGDLTELGRPVTTGAPFSAASTTCDAIENLYCITYTPAPSAPTVSSGLSGWEE